MQQHCGKYTARTEPYSSPPNLGSKGQIQLFQTIDMLHIKLKGIRHAA